MAKRIQSQEKEILDGLRNIYHVPEVIEILTNACIFHLDKLKRQKDPLRNDTRADRKHHHCAIFG